jgi:hypothetical protein
VQDFIFGIEKKIGQVHSGLVHQECPLIQGQCSMERRNSILHALATFEMTFETERFDD